MQLVLMLCGWFVIDTSSRVMGIFKIGGDSALLAAAPTVEHWAPPPRARSETHARNANTALWKPPQTAELLERNRAVP